MPTATGTQPATLTQVMSGQIDIGWGAPPFGLKEVADGKIRIIANGNDVAIAAHPDRARRHGQCQCAQGTATMRCCASYAPIARPWIGCSPVADAVKMYAEQINVPIELAITTRDKFQTREAMRNDRLSDLDAVMADAVALKFLDKPLSKEQQAELIQVPPP